MAFADDVKTYCNTDDDLSSYIGAAEASLLTAGVAKAEDNPLYALAVKMMVSCWYDNRVPDPANKAVNVPQPYGLAGIILQLQMSQGVS
ncbi:MAG TPA: head-tail connector protein [Caproicibacter sp.]|nr:head-tail connector protein [Caproicibacter sp.]